jgi:hypothetical protein
VIGAHQQRRLLRFGAVVGIERNVGRDAGKCAVEVEPKPGGLLERGGRVARMTGGMVAGPVERDGFRGEIDGAKELPHLLAGRGIDGQGGGLRAKTENCAQQQTEG